MRSLVTLVTIFLTLGALEVGAFTKDHSRSTFSRSYSGSTLSHRKSSHLFASENKKSAVIAGASGYIGRAVVKEAVEQGYETYALVRDLKRVQDNPKDYLAFKGANVVECDVCDPETVNQVMAQIAKQDDGVDAVVSCLASRSGGKKDVYKIDYQATLNCLDAGRKYSKGGHFVLLSAFCVRNPLLEFHKAKLKFEAALQNQNEMKWSIVRPTAYFKSVSGQFENMRKGNAALLFGGGEIARCNPMAESDLATYMMDCVTEPDRNKQILDIGGTGSPVTHREYNTMLFNALGIEPKFIFVPIALFDALIFAVQGLASVTRSEKFADAAETIRILRYYSTESMLTTKASEKFGTVRLEDFYDKIAKEGQDYDPFVSVLAPKNREDESAGLNANNEILLNALNMPNTDSGVLNGTLGERL